MLYIFKIPAPKMNIPTQNLSEKPTPGAVVIESAPCTEDPGSIS
jgi:hypothetical protein